MKKLVAAILALLTALSLAMPVLAQPDKPTEVVVVVVIVVARYTPQRGETLAWYYSQAGEMLGFTLNGVPYFYIRNLQGDVSAIIDANGQVVARYVYDAWGNLLYSSGYMAEINPIRYRGYYWDAETQLYYLQSRYYDPVLRRFISPDVFLDTGVGILGTNVYIYCNNDPVNLVDEDGQKPAKKKNTGLGAAWLPMPKPPTRKPPRVFEPGNKVPAQTFQLTPKGPNQVQVAQNKNPDRTFKITRTPSQFEMGPRAPMRILKDGDTVNLDPGGMAALFSSAPHVGDSMNPLIKDDLHHVSARAFLTQANWLQAGTLYIKPSDANQLLLRVPGALNGKDGHFEFIMNLARGGIVHAQFVKQSGRGSMLRYFT